MNMITTVAKAIEDNVAAALPDGIQIDWEYAAKAAIEAMREPTEEMGEVGTSVDKDNEWNSSEKAVRLIWMAMIDAALEEK